ncbi:DNA-directed RNA polymerase subunit P [Candidatus Aenigmatarchaeota archaeon]
MSGYICVKCKKDFDLEEKVRCPFCGFRILSKTRPVFRKKVQAR